MSDDDDCDLFSIVSRRGFVQDCPGEQFNPPNDSLSQDAEYDFIDTHAPSKKRGKGAKLKGVSKAKGKDTKSTEPMLKSNADVQKEPESSGEVTLARSISPVSQLILEMEENHTKEQANRRERGPVARRTRSSLGKADAASNISETANVTDVSPPKPQRRGRKPKGQSTAVEKEVSSGSRRNTRTATKAKSSESLELSIAQQKPYGNRRLVAEFAARSKVVDSIDLVSAVMPRIEGFVNLDSDEDTSSTAVKTNVLEIDSNNDNYPIDISLSWLGEIQIYKMRKYQKFTHMFKEVAKRNNVGMDDVVINMEDHFLNPHESPYSIGLKNFHVLSGRAIKSNNNNNNLNKLMADANSVMALTRKPKKFQLKVQSEKMKHPLIIPMKKTDSFNILYIQCAEELNCDVRDIQLFFDGDLLDPKDTPINQDMEGNEMIDMRRRT